MNKTLAIVAGGRQQTFCFMLMLLWQVFSGCESYMREPREKNTNYSKENSRPRLEF